MTHLEAKIDAQIISVDIDSSSQVVIDGTAVEVQKLRSDPHVMRLKIEDKFYTAYIQQKTELSYEIWINEHVIAVSLESEKSKLLSRFLVSSISNTGEMTVRAPMPGLVSEIHVKAGEMVTIGKSLLILEAMKMENEIRSVSEGRVKQILVERKIPVEKNQPLLIIEAVGKD
jgi:biotin carboxyl carrier protein